MAIDPNYAQAYVELACDRRANRLEPQQPEELLEDEEPAAWSIGTTR